MKQEACHGQKGTYVELTEISQDLQNAVIATEDRTFYENGGINYSRFILAILTAGRSGGGVYHYPAVGQECLSVSGPDHRAEGQGIFPGSGNQ